MARVLVVGSANMDLITPIERLPKPGETLAAGPVAYAPGGKGANAAIAAARAGADVRFAGRLGTDAFGQTLRGALAAAGVDTQQAAEVEGASGLALILLQGQGGQNSILVSPGANGHVQAPTDPAWYAGADVLLLQLEIPPAAALDAARRARAEGVVVMLDPAPATPPPPAELLRAADYLLPNQTELAALTGRPADTIEQAAEAAELLRREHQIGAVIVTLGEQGAAAVTDAGVEHFAPFAVTAVDSTAAGDAFAGALAERIGEGDPLPAAIRTAAAAGALTCTQVGAQSSIPTRQQVREFLAEQA